MKDVWKVILGIILFIVIGVAAFIGLQLGVMFFMIEHLS